jgi:ribosomal protein L30
MWIVVRQIRSPIRRPGDQRQTLIGLGLGRIGRVATFINTPTVRGMIRKVQHLVQAWEVAALTASVEAQLATLRRFNRRVARVEGSRFWRRYKDELPNAIMRFEHVDVESTGPTTLTITGRVHSVLEDFDQDELDAFVLSYRVFTQDNDPLSIRALSRIYEGAWMPEEARQNFEEARSRLNEYFDSTATVEFGDTKISVRDLVDIIVYGGLAHSNPRKAEIFESWQKSGVMGLIWAEFFACMREFMEVLEFLKRLNEQVLANAKHFLSPAPG